MLTFLQGSDIVMMLLSTALVFLMIPGIALVYSGAADLFSAITMARIPLITTAFVGIQVSLSITMPSALRLQAMTNFYTIVVPLGIYARIFPKHQFY